MKFSRRCGVITLVGLTLFGLLGIMLLVQSQQERSAVSVATRLSSTTTAPPATAGSKSSIPNEQRNTLTELQRNTPTDAPSAAATDQETSIFQALSFVCDGFVDRATDLKLELKPATTHTKSLASATTTVEKSHSVDDPSIRRRRRVPKLLPLELSSVVSQNEIRGEQPCGRFVQTSLRFDGLPPIEMCVWKPEKDRYISQDISHGRVWDQHVVDFLRRSVPAVNQSTSPGAGLVVDGGANIGEFTLLGLALGHTVLSFEPIADHVEMMARSVLLNDHARGLDARRNPTTSFAARLRLYRAGLSDVRQRARAEVPRGNHGGAILRRLLSVPEPAPIVELITLDDVLPLSYTLAEWPSSTDAAAASQESPENAAATRQVPPLLFVKLDVEGYEARALRGATHLLADHPPAAMAIELSARMFKAVECDPTALIRALHRLGYSLTGNGYGAIGQSPEELEQYTHFLERFNTVDVFATLTPVRECPPENA
mmetsp:Transcript_9604/g.29603  ORF Transcript_9604/g.29603 Transcript_9604/m.29603 type:complete len:486 (+) Transcript_9604:82-1539(+)